MNDQIKFDMKAIRKAQRINAMKDFLQYLFTLPERLINAVQKYFTVRRERIEARRAVEQLEQEARALRAKAQAEVSKATIEIAALLSEITAARKRAMAAKFPPGGIVAPGNSDGPEVDGREWMVPRKPPEDILNKYRAWRTEREFRREVENQPTQEDREPYPQVTQDGYVIDHEGAEPRPVFTELVEAIKSDRPIPRAPTKEEIQEAERQAQIEKANGVEPEDA